MQISKPMCFVLSIFCYLANAHAQGGPEGTWTTIDDKTGVKRAIVKLAVANNTLNGTIEGVYPQPGDVDICQNCPGTFKNKPVKGLQFMWGLKRTDNDSWGDGQVLDVQTGKIYRVKLTVKGDKLYIRGYVGVSVLGRTQIWERT